MRRYDEVPVTSAMELLELVQLRNTLDWGAWKAHPKFKRDRVICEAQRQWGASDAMEWAGLSIDETSPANDNDRDTELAQALREDEDFLAKCDADRGAWIDALDEERSRDDRQCNTIERGDESIEGETMTEAEDADGRRVN